MMFVFLYLVFVQILYLTSVPLPKIFLRKNVYDTIIIVFIPSIHSFDLYIYRSSAYWFSKSFLYEMKRKKNRDWRTDPPRFYVVLHQAMQYNLSVCFFILANYISIAICDEQCLADNKSACNDPEKENKYSQGNLTYLMIINSLAYPSTITGCLNPGIISNNLNIFYRIKQ